MKAVLGTLMLGALISCAGGPAVQAGPGTSPRLAVRAARLVDPASGTTRKDVVVLIDARRIADVRSASRYRPGAGDRLIDLGDATLLPGLIDAHVHLSIGGPPRASAAAILRAGFTTVADLGAMSQRIQVVRDSIAAGAWEGPRVLAAGRWIGVKDGVCEFGGIGVVGGADAFRSRVRENIAAGADLIKACLTGWPGVAWARPDSAELSPAILRALVDAVRRAHRAGVILVYGTDGGEALALLAAGVPPADVLRAATVAAAQALGIADSVGAIERGMIADLIAVPGDPLTDLSQLLRPRFVMAGGRVVTAPPPAPAQTR